MQPESLIGLVPPCVGSEVELWFGRVVLLVIDHRRRLRVAGRRGREGQLEAPVGLGRVDRDRLDGDINVVGLLRVDLGRLVGGRRRQVLGQQHQAGVQAVQQSSGHALPGARILGQVGPRVGVLLVREVVDQVDEMLCCFDIESCPFG